MHVYGSGQLVSITIPEICLKTLNLKNLFSDKK